MNEENPPSPENKDRLAPSHSALPEATQPSPPTPCALPVSKVNAFQTDLAMVCAVLFLVMFAAFLCLLFALLEVHGACEYAPGTLTVCFLTGASAAIILALLYPLRRKEIASLADPEPRSWGCILGCTIPTVGIFMLLLGLVAAFILPPLFLLPFVTFPLFVILFRWADRFLVGSPNPNTRTIRLFIPYLPFVITIGFLATCISWPNFMEYRNLNRTIKTHMTADDVKKAWGQPLWLSEEAMVYPTKKDQLVVVFLSKSWMINIRNDDSKPGEPVYTKKMVTSPVPKVLRIAKLDTGGEFVDGYRLLSGARDSVNWIAYIESGTKLRVVDSAKASPKARERLDHLIRSGMLKEQIAKTPAIVEEDRPSDNLWR